MFVTDVKLI